MSMIQVKQKHNLDNNLYIGKGKSPVKFSPDI